MINPTKFMDRCVVGLSNISEVDDFIDRWHTGIDNQTCDIDVYLGFTTDEYAAWVDNPAILAHLVERRKAKLKPGPSYAPVYAAMYPEFAEIFREHGYALAIHGSLQRDFDLIAVPWVETPSEPQIVVDAITSKFSINLIGKPTLKLHNRVAWTISIGWGHCAIDLSFMPIKG